MLSFIMAIIALASLIGLAPHSALAVPISKTITIGMQGGGTVVVSFLGEDNLLTPNGIIEALDTDSDGTNDVIELTTLTAVWIPGQPTDPTAFTLAIPSLAIPNFNDSSQVEFEYNTGTDKITNLFVQNGNKIDCPLLTDVILCDNGGGIIIRGPVPDADFSLAIVSQGPPPTTVIPEPSTWLLLSTGLVGVMGYACSRRRRSATLQPVSVADATH